MNQRLPLIPAVVVIVVLLAVLAGASAVAAQLGSGPDQPVRFPHDVHISVAQLDCTFCHRNVDKGANASVPAVQQCMFCHSVVTGSGEQQQREIGKVREAFQNGDGIDWIRVHRVPDHVRFVHSAHIKAGVSCATCHGPVETMKKVAQVRPLKMGDCVSCHRANNAPTDCTTCHK